jgi:4-hydroxy-tetrahydrodipicolinate reductase
MSETRIGVLGCAGRMGRSNVAAILATEGAALAGGTEQTESAWVGRDIGALIGADELGLSVLDDPERLFGLSDAVVDFTTPAAGIRHAELAAETGTALVIGTTGLSDDDRETIARQAEKAAIVQAANMSLGVNLVLSLVERAASVLGPDFDIEVLEMHHRHKIDAPSGTALALGQAAATGRGIALDDVSRKVRDGITGERPRGEIGFATLRGGDVAGEHSVIFAAPGERVELAHKAGNREIFARGAIKAALWVAGKPAGLYSMRDVLGLG